VKIQNKGSVLVQIAPLFISQPRNQNHSFGHGKKDIVGERGLLRLLFVRGGSGGSNRGERQGKTAVVDLQVTMTAELVRPCLKPRCVHTTC